MQIDFSAAFDKVNHQGILYKLFAVGIGDSVLSILIHFLSDRSQHVMVDGRRSKLVNVVSGAPQGSVLIADVSTLIAVVPSPGLRVAVAESLSRDLLKVNEWCDIWRMKLNASKTNTMTIPNHPH